MDLRPWYLLMQWLESPKSISIYNKHIYWYANIHVARYDPSGIGIVNGLKMMEHLGVEITDGDVGDTPGRG